LENSESTIHQTHPNTPVNALILVDPRAGLSDHDGPNVSYLADRATYYSGIKNELYEHGINSAGRENIVNTIFESRNQALVRRVLADSGISYLLIINTGKLAADENAVTTEVFRNNEFRILKVK
jgi:hypothetical protein